MTFSVSFCLCGWIMDSPWTNRKLAQPPLFLFPYLFHNTILLGTSRLFPLCLPFPNSLQTRTHTLAKKRRGQSVECNHKGQEKERQQLSINAEIRWVVGMKQGLRRVCARVLRYWWKRIRHEKKEHPMSGTEKKENQKKPKATIIVETPWHEK